MLDQTSIDLMESANFCKVYRRLKTVGLLKAAAVAKHHEAKKEAKDEVKEQAAAEQRMKT